MTVGGTAIVSFRAAETARNLGVRAREAQGSQNPWPSSLAHASNDTIPVILRREDAEGSQNAQLEILRCAQDDVGCHHRFTGAYAVLTLGMTLRPTFA